MRCAECPVPYAIVFRGYEFTELSKSPEDLEAVTLCVHNSRYRIMTRAQWRRGDRGQGQLFLHRSSIVARSFFVPNVHNVG